MKDLLKGIPLAGPVARRIYRMLRPAPVPLCWEGSTEKYWEHRYASGRNSGVGSYGKFAEFKAEILNAFVAEKAVRSVIEFGCGDGNQLSLSNYPRYLGFDVSPTAVSLCQERFADDPTKTFKVMGAYAGETADLTLSLDVIFHLVEEELFETYIQRLFGASSHYVIIYSSDSDDNSGYEGTWVRHWKFTDWIRVNEPDWKLVERVPNRYPYEGDYRVGSFADFFIYEKASPRAA